MKNSAHTRQKSRFGLLLAVLIAVCLLALLFLLLRNGHRADRTDVGAAPAETAAAETFFAAEPTLEPVSTPEPTAEPTPEPTAEPTPEPTAEPTPEPTAEPASAVTPVGPGTYTYDSSSGTWTLSLRDNGTFTLADPDGGFHTGEGWSQNDDGTVSCGPTDIYKAPFAFSGGCSKWRIRGEKCEPVFI